MRILQAVVLLLVLPSAVLAQSTWSAIGIYPDEFGSICALRDVAGSRTVYVLQKFNIGSVSSSFRIEQSAGLTATITSVSSPYAVSGFPTTGTTIVYGACVVGDHVILEISMQFFGTSPPCSWLRIVGHPSSIDGNVETHDCAMNRRVADWLGLHVDPGLGCFCPGGGDHLCPACKPGEEPVPVSSTTWGRIKAMYQ